MTTSKGFSAGKVGVLGSRSMGFIVGSRWNNDSNGCPFGHYRNALGVCLWGIPPAGTTWYVQTLGGVGRRTR